MSEEPVVFDAYGLFVLDKDSMPTKVVETHALQHVLTRRLTSGHAVFGIQIVVPKPKTTGAICI